MDAFTQDFMTQYEKSKREAMKKARPVGGLLVEGIYEEMNLSQGFDTTNQEQAQQQQEKPELTQEELAAFPFVIETDWAAEFGDEIAATEADESCKHNEESTLQNQSCLLDKATAPTVNEVEFTDSVTVTDKSSSKPSPEPEIMLKPKENNALLSPLAPFIMETDWASEFFDQIATTEADDSSKHNDESTLQNQSCLLDQPTAAVVNEVEFSDSVNVTDNPPPKPSEPEIMLKPKETNDVLSPQPSFTRVPLTINPNIVCLQSTTLAEQQQQPTAVITSTSTSPEMVKPKMTRNNTGTITIGNNNNNISVINNDSNLTKSNMIIASKNNYRRSLRSNQTDKTYNFRIRKNSSNIVNANNNVNKSVINKKKVVHDKVNKTNKKTNRKPKKKPNNKANKSRIIKSKNNNTKSNVINKSGGTINRNNNINNPSNSITCIANIDAEMDCPCDECLLKEEASTKVGLSKDSFGEASKANNVEMVDTQQNQSAVETRPYLCATCNFRFTSYRDLQIHSAVHNNKVVLKCRFCEREFGCDTSRMNHEQIEHEKIQHYRCTWEGCRFASTARYRVVSHVGSIHFGVPPQEQRQMESAEADFGFYVRKVNSIKSEK